MVFTWMILLWKNLYDYERFPLQRKVRCVLYRPIHIFIHPRNAGWQTGRNSMYQSG